MKTAIIVCTHAVMAEGLKSAVEMICGPQEDFYAIGLAQREGLDHVGAALTQTLTDLTNQGKKALVFCDLYGATPFNASYVALCRQSAFVITGVNLPMLLETVISREDEDDLIALGQSAMDGGHEGIKMVETLLEVGSDETEEF